MISQNLEFYKLLIDSQAAYLNALHRLSIHNPSLSSKLFDLDFGSCEQSALISETEHFENIKHWVLFPIKSKSTSSLNASNIFNDWVDSICGGVDCDSRESLRFTYPENLSEKDKQSIDDVLDEQTSLLLAVGDCAFNSLGFTVAVLGGENQALLKLKNNWFNSRKMKS